MLSVVRRILGYEMTIAEWVGTALLLGAPYGVLGIVVAVLKPDHFANADGLPRVVAFVGSVAFWPVLLVTDVCTS
ncbi:MULTISPECIES: hypothetical protein [Mycolicibacterium]|jgi:hypothetical protein|uniref:ABC transporter permease n=1 Tax=Mycolicibacterium austroafricanum TaxID=39687 RepID=A0ABT8H776_MYCAO|nr:MULTISPECIES: hypothetical protein [Mycolicibacterium]MCV7130079.1 hypothetical protein [Mycolicibacterium vanbaalenii PYR-1]MDN4516613.1 hypothetical protein [Mycolicibacterium austroafricanum]MDW5610223.1 hypothetical protein [Mycolicibacterium sp. D5.8-2]QRZ05015.1 hypothetical protein JN090_18710 [Mycolicibacterium austroafricanum]QZT57258.1 hypothetical protein JN084_01095 [Mycolicibacterium austroafricanum]